MVDVDLTAALSTLEVFATETFYGYKTDYHMKVFDTKNGELKIAESYNKADIEWGNNTLAMTHNMLR